MDNERIEALNQITSDGDNYIKLSEANENKLIGKVIINDLILYIDNELKILDETGDKYQEKINQYESDKNKLEKILKTISYNSFDDIVLLKKFSKFKKKYTKLKKDLIEADEDLKIEILKDLYEKIRIVYGVKKDEKDKTYLKEIYKRVQDKNKKILIQTGGVGEDEIIRKGKKLIDNYNTYQKTTKNDIVIQPVKFFPILNEYKNFLVLLKKEKNNGQYSLFSSELKKAILLFKKPLNNTYVGNLENLNNLIKIFIDNSIKKKKLAEEDKRLAELKKAEVEAIEVEAEAEVEAIEVEAEAEVEVEAIEVEAVRKKNAEANRQKALNVSAQKKEFARQKVVKIKRLAAGAVEKDDNLNCCFPSIDFNSQETDKIDDSLNCCSPSIDFNSQETDEIDDSLNCCSPIIELKSGQEETTEPLPVVFVDPTKTTEPGAESSSEAEPGAKSSPETETKAEQETTSESKTISKAKTTSEAKIEAINLNEMHQKLTDIRIEQENENNITKENEIKKVGGMSEYSNKQIPSSKKNISEELTISDHYKNMKDLYIKLVSTYYKLIDGTDADESKTLDFLYKDEEDDGASPALPVSSALPEPVASKLESSQQVQKENKAEDGEAGIIDNKEKISGLREKESVANSNIKKNDARLKILEEKLKKMLEYLIELYKICDDVKNIPQSTEYEDYIKEILKKQKINFFEDQKNKEKHLQHPIIKAINQEINELKNKNDSLQEEIKKVGKQIGDTQLEQKYLLEKDRRTPGGYYNKMKGGYEKKDLENYYKPLTELLGVKDDKDNNLKNFVIELKNNTENIGNNGNTNKKSRNDIDNTIYEDIWNEYNIGINKSDKKDLLKNIKQGEILYDTVKINNLVPELALEINFQDKSIFIFLILLIRTIIMVIIEFIIEYNIIKTLPYMIIVYGILYILLIVFSLVLVNYDSYKLRIVFNYLNLHINSTNIILHLILFILFVFLIMIMIQSEDLIKNFGDLFDYTNIYIHIYELSILFKDENFENTLSRNEKIKLLYRLEIITMIVFIFSSFIILIL